MGLTGILPTFFNEKQIMSFVKNSFFNPLDPHEQGSEIQAPQRLVTAAGSSAIQRTEISNWSLKSDSLPTESTFLSPPQRGTIGLSNCLGHVTVPSGNIYSPSSGWLRWSGWRL